MSGDHSAFALADCSHVDFDVVLRDSELLASEEVRGDFGAMDDVLAGEAGDVGTGSADIFLLDNGNFLSLFGERPEQDSFPGSAAAKNDEVIFLRSERSSVVAHLSSFRKRRLVGSFSSVGCGDRGFWFLSFFDWPSQLFQQAQRDSGRRSAARAPFFK